MKLTLTKRYLGKDPYIAKQRAAHELKRLAAHILAGHCLSTLVDVDGKAIGEIDAPELWPVPAESRT